MVRPLAFLLLVLPIWWAAAECDEELFARHDIARANEVFRRWVEATHEPPQAAERQLTTTPDADLSKRRRNWSSTIPFLSSLCRGKLDSVGTSSKDEERKVCALDTITRQPEGGQCTIISVGSNNQWELETELFQRTPCQIFTLDCTGAGKGWAVPERLRSRVSLHEWCLSDADHNETAVPLHGGGGGKEGRRARGFLKGHNILPIALKGSPPRQYLTLASALARLGVGAAPAYLKLDCEGCEFDVLPQMLDVAATIGRGRSLLPRQIGVEIHSRNALQLTRFFQDLWLKGGYFPIDRRDNNRFSEVLLARPSCQVDFATTGGAGGALRKVSNASRYAKFGPPFADLLL